jgi:hypothetical protein
VLTKKEKERKSNLERQFGEELLLKVSKKQYVEFSPLIFPFPTKIQKLPNFDFSLLEKLWVWQPSFTFLESAVLFVGG